MTDGQGAQQLAYSLMRLKLADGEQANERAVTDGWSGCSSEEGAGNGIGYEEGTVGSVGTDKAQLYL
ncbi:MAG: hypothetical protein ACRDNW_16320, partial [Trebonia sp.]